MVNLDLLPKKLFRQALVANVIGINEDQDLITANKFGGSKPFIPVDEKWPEGLNFICQFKHPTEKIFIQFFLNINDMDDYLIRKVDTKQKYQTNPIVPEGVKILPIYKIVSWKKKRELIDVYQIHDYYMSHIEEFKTHFSEDVLDMIEFKSTHVFQIISEFYLFSGMVADCPLLKLDGVPYSEEDASNEYLEEGILMQIGGACEIKLPFKVGHITVDDLVFIYEK